MCGLVFSININLDLDICDRFLKRRGPDASGHFFNEDLQAYHTRLKIFDLSDNSNQPYTDDGHNFLLFNGSIYNFKDLIKKYEIDQTSSDTVVIYKLIRKYGPKIVEEFNGMFAIVFFNILDNNVYFIRDRYGIKPLYYYKYKSKFIISSSAKLIAKHLDLDINDEYVSFGIENGFYDEFNHSPYQNVFPVKPGSVSRLFDNKLETNFYYQINKCTFYNEDFSELRDILIDSVNTRLIADRAIGISQSGGVDSSIISFVTSKSIDTKLKAFCFGSKDKQSEYFNAKRHSDKCGLDLINVEPKNSNKSFLDLVNDVIDVQEAPFLGTSIVAQYLVFQKANEQKITVMLGGQGADELFCGYKKYLYFNRFSVFSLFNVFYEILFNGYDFELIKKKFLRKKSSPRKFQYDFSSINNLSLQDLTYTSLPTLLRYEDRNSMAFSIETRLPFLDYRLVDYVNSKNKSNFIRFGFTKYILRKMFNGQISSKIIWNIFKRGFDTSDYFENDSNILFVNKYISSNKQYLPSFLSNYVSHTNQLKDWSIILSCLWYINELKDS
ncbi:Asparagine synthetase (glutamine-hydrolyzing) [Aequoribacter fuscus]|uniref:asparagine synthase (glutamine-hydrolyzing) n=1 Tax=Aequoribacter fuscus TaxID=2518989 RepID=F3L3Q9_9GAMM|nr:asparagine synthase (glutamine-hydrolyzing) [Aequoribacter fuscus]EGG29032.1 Asparagine synthetase (glutamine-hydrolyzing) [Aequoribacter fuscus]QHJ88887.1 asparagine synthase (glutamine-hydrolyzing) [Aequoribacter fuscus]